MIESKTGDVNPSVGSNFQTRLFHSCILALKVPPLIRKSYKDSIKSQTSPCMEGERERRCNDGRARRKDGKLLFASTRVPSLGKLKSADVDDNNSTFRFQQYRASLAEWSV